MKMYSTDKMKTNDLSEQFCNVKLFDNPVTEQEKVIYIYIIIAH